MTFLSLSHTHIGLLSMRVRKVMLMLVMGVRMTMMMKAGDVDDDGNTK